jgi:hypothetical protein
LCTLYRIQFPVLRKHDQNTFYDSNGRLVFSTSGAYRDLGIPLRVLPTKKGGDIRIVNEHSEPVGWEDIRDYKTGTVSKTFMDDTLPDGPHQRTIEYTAPFFCPDREEDYRVAWEFFESKD